MPISLWGVVTDLRMGLKRMGFRSEESDEIVENNNHSCYFYRMHMEIKGKVREFVKTFKTLQGNPHYIAVGMAIGVFISITPTIPFHTALAIALAFIFNGSKPAAAIGVWLCNPITLPFFYVGSYKIGMLILNKSIPLEVNYKSVPEFMQMGFDVTVAMITGGILLGIIPGIAAYFITRKMVIVIRSRSKKNARSSQLTDS